MIKSTVYRSSVHPSYLRSYQHHHISLKSADRPGHFGSGKLWWEDTGTFLNQGGKQEAADEEERTPTEARMEMCAIQLTADFRILIRVVSAVVFTVAFPGQRLTQSVVALKLIQGAVTPNCRDKSLMEPHFRLDFAVRFFRLF